MAPHQALQCDAGVENKATRAYAQAELTKPLTKFGALMDAVEVLDSYMLLIITMRLGSPQVHVWMTRPQDAKESTSLMTCNVPALIYTDASLDPFCLCQQA
jgi:hypothetical protein